MNNNTKRNRRLAQKCQRENPGKDIFVKVPVKNYHSATRKAVGIPSGALMDRQVL